MKRLLLVLTCAVVLAMAVPFAAFPAHKQQGAGSDHKHHWFSFHRTHKEKHQADKHDSLHNFPRSVGWWHHYPGPAGAGA
jgi:hypothetical protein